MESSKRIKLSLSKKLKEYANKMGRDHLGGDDIPGNKKRGGLRDNDGYDNVQFNRDMPQDESVDEALSSRVRKIVNALVGDFKYVLKNNGKVLVIKDKMPNMIFKRMKKDFQSLGYNATKDLKGNFMVHLESVNEAKLSTIHKAAKKGSYPVSLVVIKNGKVIKQVLNIKTPAEVPAAFNVVKNYHKHKDATVHIEDRTGKRLFSEACWKGYKAVGGKIKNGKQVPNCVPESVVQEAMRPSQIRSAISKVKKQLMRKWKQKGGYENFGQKELDKMKSKFDYNPYGSSDERQISKMLDGFDNWAMNYDGNMREELSETTLFNDFLLEGGLPQNWMAGRVSDYHTKLRGKRKDYDDTNFAKMNTGQPDIEDEELDSDNEVVNEKFNKVEHLSLLNKALKAIPGSQKQKEIIRQLNVVRKAGGMRPLKETAIEEYGQRLDLSYILDDESVLDGTPEPKDAINKESAKKKTEKNYKDWKSRNEGSSSAAQRAAIAISKKEKAGKPGYDKEGKSLKKEESKRDYKDEYKKFQSSTKSKKYRAELNKYNRDKGTYGNGDGKDASHKGGKIVGFESESKNRGRAEKSRLKKK